MTGPGNPIQDILIRVCVCLKGYCVYLILYMLLGSVLYTNNRRTVEVIKLFRPSSSCRLIIDALIKITGESKSAPKIYYFFKPDQ